MLIISTILMTPVVIGLSYLCLPARFAMDEQYNHVEWYFCAISVLMGLWS